MRTSAFGVLSINGNGPARNLWLEGRAVWIQKYCSIWCPRRYKRYQQRLHPCKLWGRSEGTAADRKHRVVNGRYLGKFTTQFTAFASSKVHKLCPKNRSNEFPKNSWKTWKTGISRSFVHDKDFICLPRHYTYQTRERLKSLASLV